MTAAANRIDRIIGDSVDVTPMHPQDARPTRAGADAIAAAD